MPTSPQIPLTSPVILDLVRFYLSECPSDKMLEELRQAVIKIYTISDLGKPLNPAVSLDDDENRHRYEATAPMGWEFNRVLRSVKLTAPAAEKLIAAHNAAATAAEDENAASAAPVAFAREDKPQTLFLPGPNIDNEIHITRPANISNPSIVSWPEVLQRTAGRGYTGIYYSIRPTHRPWLDPPQLLESVSETFFSEFRVHLQAEAMTRLMENLSPGMNHRDWKMRAKELSWQLQKKVSGASGDDMPQDEAVDGRPWFAPRDGGVGSSSGLPGGRNTRVNFPQDS